ncbi:MAG TPA: outer membrane protein assembly factor BamA [Burkholderiaceae bacterium]|nr:outer membrane protein assembly factor BamA [Burkholderiaceae bacterium]
MRTIAAAVVATWCLSASAQEFVVRDIRVEGVQRTEPGTVFSYLPIRVGDRFDPERGTQAIRALYASGLFKDVRLEVDGDVLVVIVDERPAIAAIDLTGVTEFEKDQVLKSLRDVGLAEGRIFDRSLLDRAEQELRRQYLSRGLYGVDVKTTVTPIERNRVNVSIAAVEGEIARIRSITFTGNNVFSDGVLRSQMELSTPNWLSWYTKRDQYSRQKLSADLETVRSYYLNRGYLDFKIESVQVSISPDKRDIFVSVNVSEGERYNVSGIKLTGELLGLDEELQPLIDVKPGEVFSAERINAIAKRVTDRMSTLGYAFASANPVPEPDREKRQVAFTIVVDPGRRVYVRRVNIAGNNRTRDEVIRREVRQYESAWFDSDRVRLSRDRIDRLGFFESVTVDTPAVPTAPDQVDVNVTVKERATGNIQIGAGYSSAEGLVLSGGIAQQNLFGSGNALSLEINTSKANRIIALAHTDPYVTTEGISRSLELFYRKSDLAELGLSSVGYSTLGGGVVFGVPFTEFDRVFFGLRYENTEIELTPFSPLRYVQYVEQFGAVSDSLALTTGWSRDDRDNLLVPTRGRYQRVFTEVGLPGLDLQYYRLTYQFQQYFALFPRVTLAFNGEIGYGDGYSGDPYPFFKNYYVGGIGSVRGFETGSLGPRDIDDSPLGGNRRINFSFEAYVPIPGADRTLRALTFIDAGWVWGQEVRRDANGVPVFVNGRPQYENGRVDLGDLRYSVGLGVAWISPLGPLRLSYAYPINKKPEDRIQRFQFQIGTGF